MKLTDGVDDDRMIRDDTGTWRERGDARRSRNVIVDVIVGVSLYTDFSVTSPTSSISCCLTGLVFHIAAPRL